MGDERVTTLNLRVERIDGEQHLLMLKGTVPAPGSYVIVRRAVAPKPSRSRRP